MARKRLGEILVQAGVLPDAQLRAALAEQRRWGGPLGRILVDMKFITEETMVQALSHQLNFPTVDLDQRQIEPPVLDLVPGELAEQHSVVPFNVQGKFLDVAMSDPTNLGIIDELRIRTRLNVRPYLAGPQMVERALVRCYGRSAMSAFGVASADPAAAAADPAVPLNMRFVDVVTDAGSGPVRLPAQPATGSLAAVGSGSPVVAREGGPSPASARRAAQFELQAQLAQARGQEIVALQGRVSQLEALVARDEDVIRKLLGLLIDKGVATREEILDRIK